MAGGIECDSSADLTRRRLGDLVRITRLQSIETAASEVFSIAVPASDSENAAGRLLERDENICFCQELATPRSQAQKDAK